MTDFLVDTDVFIDHLRAAHRMPIAPHVSAYSVITRAELYVGASANESVVDALLGVFEEIPIDRVIAEEGGRIRRTLGLGLADALIAATALAKGVVLVSRNLKHYERVSGLKVHPPQ